MLLFKVAPVLLLALAVRADKKIELQDIEEDNLKSERDKDIDKIDPSEPRNPPQDAYSALDFFKSGLLRYFENKPGQQPRYMPQYAVTEQPEAAPVPPAAHLRAAAPKHQQQSAPQQAMVGYLSNVPMQVYLVPQYYNEPAEQAANPQAAAVQFIPSVPSVPRAAYAPPEMLHQNYIEVPGYVSPNGKAFIQQYSAPITYVYSQPTAAPQATVTSPMLAYQMPLVQYPTALAAPPVVHKGYYDNTRYTDTNTVDDVHEEEEPAKHYLPQPDTSYGKPPLAEYPRYYNSRTPIREDYKPVSELPPPNPLVLKNPPPHLAHLPKALPMYRPLTKAVYSAGGGNFISSAYNPRPNEQYGVPKRRPTSLLDSYVPSGLQVEYLKRGYSKDPLVVYDALANGRHFSHINQPIARHYERGFLPNQMYHTAAGGITYGHYKRAPKAEKVHQK